jgi:hypothetical protein
VDLKLFFSYSIFLGDMPSWFKYRFLLMVVGIYTAGCKILNELLIMTILVALDATSRCS